MLHCGLLGRKLGHSYSPALHHELADYEYLLYEKEPFEIEGFLKSGEWDGLNVTIPYKKAVVPLIDELSDIARKLGSVNTIVKRSDGTLYGDNTDAFGFDTMITASGIHVENKKVIVLGTGGASVTVKAVLESRNAKSITFISRSGPDNYTNLERHADAQIIVNATPVGMYPENGKSPVDLKMFMNCEGVLDIVYNPARTALILQAEELGIKAMSGLIMLVAQAKRSSELFTGKEISNEVILPITKKLQSDLMNIVLIGMPGCGKSTIASELSKRLNRKVIEADQLIEDRVGKLIPQIFAEDGEDTFRALETQILTDTGKLFGTIISTGGGCIKKSCNYPLLHQNGVIIWIKRSLDSLAKDGRPLSQKFSVQELYQEREPLYRKFADIIVENNDGIDSCTDKILEAIR